MKRPLLTLTLALLSMSAEAEVKPDRGLLDEIRAIRAVDGHVHIPSKSAPGKPPSDGSLGRTPFPYPVRLRVDNPQWLRAWKSLYGVTGTAVDAATATDMLERKRALQMKKGDEWATSILDAVQIETALVNMPSLPRGAPGRFRWVPQANALVYPFGGLDDPRETVVDPLPDTLDRYVGEVVTKSVLRWKSEGAVALKISLAYNRSLAFGDVAAADASAAYSRLRAQSPAPAADDYAILQDFLFRELARLAGRAGLVMHVHTGIGADPWFRIAGANPLLLEPSVTDTTLRQTNFVLIHGGWPFEEEAGVMLIKPNVYADFSAQTFLRSPRALAGTLRSWLEWYPEKVLFGTDAYPDSETPHSDWEEMLWLANDSAREALAIALTGMMNDGQITRARAAELARMVLRENAMKLYKLK